MCGKILVPFFISRILWDEVEIFSADDQCAVHLGRHHGSSQNTASNGDQSGERAFLV